MALVVEMDILALRDGMDASLTWLDRGFESSTEWHDVAALREEVDGAAASVTTTRRSSRSSGSFLQRMRRGQERRQKQEVAQAGGVEGPRSLASEAVEADPSLACDSATGHDVLPKRRASRISRTKSISTSASRASFLQRRVRQCKERRWSTKDVQAAEEWTSLSALGRLALSDIKEECLDFEARRRSSTVSSGTILMLEQEDEKDYEKDSSDMQDTSTPRSSSPSVASDASSQQQQGAGGRRSLGGSRCCGGCGVPYAGFGAMCGSCRRAGAGASQQCRCCGTFFWGLGGTCSDCCAAA